MSQQKVMLTLSIVGTELITLFALGKDNYYPS